MRGFTLVEMVVVLMIIVLVTTIAITGQNTFNRSLILTDTAYTIAFSLREAQALGLSSRFAGTNTLGANIYNAGYGIRFSTLTPTSYVLYADTYPAEPGSQQGGDCPGHTEPSTSPDAHPGNCLYDPSATSPAELIRTYTLNQGYTIYKFCGREDGGSNGLLCSDEDFETMHLTFMRPSTDSAMFGLPAGGGAPIPLSDATIYLRAPGATDSAGERCILVSKVGQIAVDSCP